MNRKLSNKPDSSIKALGVKAEPSTASCKFESKSYATGIKGMEGIF
jgi:hypothetical protein